MASDRPARRRINLTGGETIVTAEKQAPVALVDDQVMLVVRIDTKPGAQSKMSSALAQLVEAPRRQDRGVVRFEVGIDPADDTRVVGFEIWESQAALDEHAEHDHTQ